MEKESNSNGNPKPNVEVSAERKLQGGKYLKISITLSRDTIENYSITGDFFIYPESFIDNLEDVLRGKKVESGLIMEHLRQYKENYNEPLEIIGISYEDILELTQECINNLGNPADL